MDISVSRFGERSYSRLDASLRKFKGEWILMESDRCKDVGCGIIVDDFIRMQEY